MTESPDFLQGLETFKACDKSGMGMLNAQQFYEYNCKQSEYMKAKYGGDVPFTKEISDKWYNIMKWFTPGDGIALADIKHSMKLYEICLSGKDTLKLSYFNKYGRGEPIRMALWKAGVEYEDCIITNE